MAQDTLIYTVNTPKKQIQFSNLGAGPVKIQLKEYQKWDETPVQMIADTTRSAYSLGFVSTQNYNIETDQLLFTQLTEGSRVSIEEGQTSVSYALTLLNSSR